MALLKAQELREAQGEMEARALGELRAELAQSGGAAGDRERAAMHSLVECADPMLRAEGAALYGAALAAVLRGALHRRDCFFLRRRVLRGSSPLVQESPSGGSCPVLQELPS